MPDVLNVLIADDSPTARELLAHIVNEADKMRVVGTARNGREAIELTQKLRPNVVLMDLLMPGVDGLEATREIMATAPTPIVVISASLEHNETEIAFEAISAGALAVHRKPDGLLHPHHAEQAGQLINKARLMAGVRVIHHRRRNGDLSAYVASPPPPRPATVYPPEIVAIVASTGGPAALTTIMRDLPPNCPSAIVIVQHISSDFVPSLVSWMASTSPLPVTVAEHDQQPQLGGVYLAPGGAHLRLTRWGRFHLSDDPPGLAHMPSGDVLLESVARYYGARAVGVVLTGIGDDGARGLRAMFDAGAYTIAQDEESSVVYGMPKAAKAMGGVRQVLPLAKIAETLSELVRVRSE